MLSNPNQVVVTPAGYSIVASHTSEVHHRNFPEVRGEGHSLADAAARLADLLARTLDSVPSDWRRETLEQAIADVRAFARGEGV
jgi:hypothetical protein